MEEERCFNNWDLGAVVRLGCRRRLSPPRQPYPFASFLPPPLPSPPPQKEKRVVPAPPAKEPEPEPHAAWRFPDLGGAGGGQDGDELLRALLAAPPPLPQPLPTPEAHQGLPLPKGILPVQQLQGVRGEEAGGAQPGGPQHLHPHLHRRAQPRGADPPQLARRHHPPQVPLLGGTSAAAAVRGGGRRRSRRRAAPAAEPEPDVHIDWRGAVAHDAAAHAVHGGGRRRGGGRAAGGGHGDGRRGRAAVPQHRRRRCRGTHVLALRRRRRALPKLPLGDDSHR